MRRGVGDRDGRSLDGLWSPDRRRQDKDGWKTGTETRGTLDPSVKVREERIIMSRQISVPRRDGKCRQKKG